MGFKIVGKGVDEIQMVCDGNQVLVLENTATVFVLHNRWI
jgi:hypothetical protein